MKKLQADKHMKAEGAHDGDEKEDEDEKEMSEKEHEAKLNLAWSSDV